MRKRLQERQPITARHRKAKDQFETPSKTYLERNKYKGQIINIANKTVHKQCNEKCRINCTLYRDPKNRKDSRFDQNIGIRSHFQMKNQKSNFSKSEKLELIYSKFLL